jgi:hypothetical protein
MPKEKSSTSEGEPKRNQHGGDRSSPQAKADAAKRVKQIVALRLRGYTFGAISKAVGITESAAQKSFMAALVRNSDETLETYHRAELLALELQEAEIWRVIDGVENQNDYRVVAPCMDKLNRIHVRRALLLGLDAPKTLNDQAIFKQMPPRAKARVPHKQ